MIACPGCGAGLRFDIASQAMLCDHCGESYDPYAFDSKEKDAEVTQSFDARLYSCSSCGAELLTTDESDITSFCPYCGNSSILFDRLKKVEYPAHIIPFRLTKEDCKKAYAREARKAIFTPKRYKSPERIDSFRGIYMPYWSYEADYDGAFSIDADSKETREGDYLVTEHYNISGTVKKHCEGYTHDASQAFSDEISECLAPYDTAQQQPFTPGYLSGFYADAADVDEKAYLARAREYSDEQVRTELQASPSVSAQIGSNSVSSVSLPKPKTCARMAMYPVWFMSYREGDRITYAAVNGQTGKVAADFPVSTGRYLAAVLVLAAALFCVFNFLLTLKPEWALGITTVLMLLGLWAGNNPYRRASSQVSEAPRKTRRSAVSFVIIWNIVLGSLGVVGLCLGHLDTAGYAFGGFLLALLLFTDIFMIKGLRDMGPDDVSDPADARTADFWLPGVVKLLVWGMAAVSVVIIFVMKPVYNMWYYIPSLIEAVVLFLVILQSFRYQLERATRRPPQFNKKGGDDDA